MNQPARIALVGFMGSGKTTVGRLLAERLGYAFIDSDDEIEARAGARVSDIFRLHGEGFFRELEAGTIRELLQGSARVIATGGGALTDPACAEALLSGAFTVHLSCDFNEACRRAANQGGRPLLARGEMELGSLYAERKAKYSRAHATVDTTRRTPDEVVAAVLRLLQTP